MVACGGKENLGFMSESAEGFGVDDAIPVSLEGEAVGAGGFGLFTAFGVVVEASKFGEGAFFSVQHFLVDGWEHGLGILWFVWMIRLHTSLL
jgi:hypothetical protein